MLPVVMYNMEGSSNTIPNSNFGSVFDDNVILNCVRSRKKVTELPNCPVCSCTIRQGELDTHLCLEVERLNKLSNGGSKRKLSANSPGSSNPMPGSSSSVDNQSDVDVSGCLGSDVYQRVHTNRLKRLRARRRSPPPQQGECPVCNATLPVSRLQRHALRCLKRTGAEMDEDIPDTSSEDGSIDVENDEPSGFGAEYQWCGEWRVRAAALQGSEARPATCVRRASTDRALVVDGDEDTELYGPAQYSPSRIAPDADIPVEDEETEQNVDDVMEEATLKPNGIVEASAETRIQALKEKIKDLEKKQNSSLEAKCLICLGPYISPAVSIQCWHVYCEVCWLQSLRAKKICPQCNAITTADHLRRIYM
ncbi:E3 ubiquitin-protein ligase RNF220 isoform X1 [Vanessa atalanta]|uniref:E3 ubiquitin-protein ligase RNF220 isoform X1 n=1 Tax=Vanessa atalanta TaxID=42275 RepID=UPI000E77B291|nr:E3 ubiquitin-protein ligase RNF220 [Vanessa tameamea]XP_047542968.1 E3 ubiquitin-protein ligase RNF220 isoform X1 [Vanessa atalanta]